MTKPAAPTDPRPASGSLPAELLALVSPPVATVLPAAPLPLLALRERPRPSTYAPPNMPLPPLPRPAPGAASLARLQPRAPQKSAPLPSRAAHWLQQGNALYLHSGVEKAVPYWLQALALGPDLRLAATLLDFHRELGKDVAVAALVLLQVSWMQPSSADARHAYHSASCLWPEAHDVTRHLLVAAKRDGQLHEVHARLTQRFAALLPGSIGLQHELVAAVFHQDYFAASSLARALHEAYPHLLAPRCVTFVCQFALGGGMAPGGTFVRQSIAQARHAAQVMAFALSRGQDGQLDAVGALTLSEHRDMWRAFLERAYATEPSVFGAEIFADGGTAALSFGARHVAGMPWNEALKLPLAEAWTLAPEMP